MVPVEGSATLLRFTQDYAFDSPSGAAGVVSGTGLNGRAHWKVQDKAKPYKEWHSHKDWEEKLVNEAAAAGSA